MITSTQDFRIDRLVTLYLRRPLCRVQRSTSIPILMYHSISGSQEDRVHPYYRTVTTPQTFARQMEYLYNSGYSTLGLSELDQRLQRGTRMAKCVAITFDDGYLDFYLHAAPVLAKYGFTATVFLPTAFIGKTRQSFNDTPCLTWAEVRELRQVGIAFGSHTHTHPQLHDLSPDAIEQEITASKKLMEDEMSTAVESFGYPFAFPETDLNFRARLSHLLDGAGYTNGVCTTIGRADRARSSLFMKRLPINSCDDSRLFEAKLLGAYDWIESPQRWVKIAKAWRDHGN
jgi:peptidoglycan/xylan/chitin deacetylase (PgdA/CDA1 family)